MIAMRNWFEMLPRAAPAINAQMMQFFAGRNGAVLIDPGNDVDVYPPIIPVADLCIAIWVQRSRKSQAVDAF